MNEIEVVEHRLREKRDRVKMRWQQMEKEEREDEAAEALRGYSSPGSELSEGWKMKEHEGKVMKGRNKKRRIGPLQLSHLLLSESTMEASPLSSVSTSLIAETDLDTSSGIEKGEEERDERRKRKPVASWTKDKEKEMQRDGETGRGTERRAETQRDMQREGQRHGEISRDRNREHTETDRGT